MTINPHDNELAFPLIRRYFVEMDLIANKKPEQPPSDRHLSLAREVAPHDFAQWTTEAANWFQPELPF